MATTQISKRQIADGAIDNSKIDAAAAIATSKLTDGANFIKRDGSVAMTGNLDLGNQKIVNVQAPSSPNDVTNKTYVDTAVANAAQAFSMKTPAMAASTANVTISNPGTASFDGVTLATGERILLKNQTAPAENGIYIFATSSTALTRATDMDAWTEVPGAIVIVQEGTTQADTLWIFTANNGGTLGTTAITVVQFTGTGYTTSNFVDKEVPTGSINGSNVTFTLANTPTTGSEGVYLNGALQQSGSGNDYTISGAVITMLAAPLTGEKILVSYRK